MLRPSLSLAGLLALTHALPAGIVTVEGRRFTLPDGFTVEKVATTNEVLRPVNACFDDQGRLYVTDASGSSAPPAEQAKDPRWRVIRLESTRHDGVFDKSIVFADRLPMLQGILWHQGAVYIGGTPAIWKLTDRDGDGRADERVEWWNVGRPSTHCGNEVHGPYAGPDGFLYWTKGAFEPIRWTNGVTHEVHVDRGAHIFRARPDGSEFDSIMTGGMDNPVEVAFTRDGECLFTSTFIDFSQPEYRDGIGHAIYGAVYGKENSNVEDRAVKRTGPALLHPFIELGAAAPSGLCRLSTSSFGAGYQDNFFASLFNLHKITRHQVRPKGATFTAETSDFLVAEDTDFHPTDVLESPDGSLIVADTGGWYKLCCPTSQLWKPDVLGTLYRVRRVGGEGVASASQVKSSAVASTVRRGSTENWRSRVVEARGEPFAQHAIIEALIRTGENADLREAFLSPGSDAAVRRAALIALSEREGAPLALLEVTPLLSSADAQLHGAAEWVIRRRSEWAAELSRWTRTQLPAWAPHATADQAKAILPLIVRDPEGQEIVAECARRADFPPALRLAAFESMGGIGGSKQPPASWAKAVAEVIADPGAGAEAASNNSTRALLAAALRLAAQMKESPVEALTRLSTNRAAPLDLRIESIAARPGHTPLSAAEFETLKPLLLPEVAPSLRSAGVRALTRAGLTQAQKASLTETLGQVGPLELPPLLGLYEGVEDPSLGHDLIKVLGTAKARGALRPDLLKPCLARLPAASQPEAQALISLVAPDSAAQGRRIDSLLSELKGLTTDIRRGQAVFNSTKAACVQCHQIGYAGGEVGPNLTKVGEVRSERDLLEAVVFPSASFVRSYEPLVVITRDGEVHTGIVRDETDAGFTLVTGPGQAAELHISRKEVQEQRPSAVSLMPAGLEEQLSRQELADLIAFLKNTHWGVK